MAEGVYPPDIDTEVGEVRYTTGDVEEPYLVSDELIQKILDKYPDETAEARIYYTSIRVLRILTVVTAGEGSRRREKEYGVEVEVYDASRYDAFRGILDDLLANPPDNVDSLDANRNFGRFYFGGTSRADFFDFATREDANGPLHNMDSILLNSGDVDDFYNTVLEQDGYGAYEKEGYPS